MESARMVPVPESAPGGHQHIVHEMVGQWAEHAEGDYLKAYALGQLPAELSLIVEFHLRMCASCGFKLREIRASIGHWTETEKLPRLGGENRKSVRVPTDDPAFLTVLHPEPSGRIDTRVLDISKQGLRLAIPRELMKGAVIQVRLRDLFILAEVRYCRSVKTGFHAGVLIQDVFANSGCLND
jgi:PilZ domain